MGLWVRVGRGTIPMVERGQIWQPMYTCDILGITCIDLGKAMYFP